MYRKNGLTLLLIWLAVQGASLLSESPSWLLENKHKDYTYTGSSCVGVTKGLDAARQLANLKAKSAILLSYNGRITASRHLTEISVEGVEVDEATSSKQTLEERYTIKGEGFLSGLEVIEQGIYDIKREENFCIWLGANLINATKD